MQYHVVQTRTSGDLPGHVSRLTHWNSDKEDQGYWIKNPNTNKYVHVEFLTYEYIKKEDWTHYTGHSWFLLKQDTADPTNLNWYTTLSEQIENDNFFQLGHWKETDPQFQSGCHMMYPPAATPQLLEIATTPHIEMEEVTATVTAPAPPAETKLANGNQALSGVPPPIFNGDREKSEHFLDKFISYKIINGDARQFTIPYLKVALCLSYLNGPKIDAWARQQRLWLKNCHEQDGVLMTDKSLWEDFKLLFRMAYTDQDAKLTMYQKLNDLRMQGSDIDSYIADFNRLIDEAGYNKFDMGVMIKFKEGLQPSLLREILLHNVLALSTLSAWCLKARERQTVYKELKKHWTAPIQPGRTN